MDSQTDSETLNNILENDMILIRGGESDTDFLGPDLDVNCCEDIHTTKPFSILDELMPSLSTHNSTNTTMSTPSSAISHQLSSMIITTAHSTISTNKSTPTKRYQPTAVSLSTSRTPPQHTSYTASPLPIYPNPPFTTRKNSKLRPPMQNSNTCHSPSTSSQSPILHLQTKITHK